MVYRNCLSPKHQQGVTVALTVLISLWLIRLPKHTHTHTKKKAVCMVREGDGGVEGFSGAVQARSAKICLMHSLNLGACAGFSQGYRRGL